LYAENNPWQCDCHSLDFKNYLMSLAQDSSNVLYHQFQCATTAGPMFFEDVDASQFVCGDIPDSSTASLQISALLMIFSALARLF